MTIDVEFSLHPFKIHCTALKVRAMVAPEGSVPDPGSVTPTAIRDPGGDPTVLGSGNIGNTGNAIGNTTGNEVAPGSEILGNTVSRDLGKNVHVKKNIMTMEGVENTPPNTVQENILVHEEKRYGNHPVRNAPGKISKGDQVDGKWHRKRNENQDQDTEKYVIKFVCLRFFPFFIFFLFSKLSLCLSMTLD